MSDSTRSAYLQAMGIPQWLPRDVVEEAAVGEDGGASVQPVSADVSALDWPALRDAALACRECALAEGRTQVVFGVGDQKADWMIIGEAPGEQEDLQGEPFVGRAGLLLNNMLMAVGLSRETVYIANVVKCRPPRNRDPQPEEIGACQRFLRRQIELIGPKLILVVGRVAAQTLLETDAPVGRMRGRVHRYPGMEIPLVVTYHPAYLLRRPIEKRKSWDDLKLARSAITDNRPGA
ncbi:MAG TPA: uracil-DNA glycosylase [Gammaproteobacteria bacterium]|nr:uracil-DNA glycosylase [Gammaproteobacteria bacterium]